MGYVQRDGKYANTREVELGPGEVTANGVGDEFEMGDRGVARLTLEVISADVGGGTNHTQEIVFENVTGGFFSVSVGDLTTDPIDFGSDDLAATLEAELENLFGSNNVSVSLSGSDLVIEFVGALAGSAGDDIDLLVVNDLSLEGEGVDVQVTKTEDGKDGEFSVAATVETSEDATEGSWRDVGSFATATDRTPERKCFAGCDRFIRVKWVLTGQDPSIIFRVHGEAC